MQQEALCEVVTVSMTARDKVLLIGLAQEHGATMRGLLRKLIRDAAARTGLMESVQPLAGMESKSEQRGTPDG